MSLKEDLARCERHVEQLLEKNSKLQDEIQNLKYQLQQYQNAMAAVKWLGDQVSTARSFDI